MCMEYFEPAGTADGDLSVPVSVQRSVWEISGCSQQEYHCMEAVHF